MSHPNWSWQQGRGNFGQRNYGHGPRYAVQNSQVNRNEWYPAHSQGASLYGEQGPGFGHFMGRGYVPQPANNQWGGPFFVEQGHGFRYYMGERNVSDLASSQWSRPSYGEQGYGFGYHGRNEHPSNLFNSQRSAPFYQYRGRGFGYAENAHPFNSLRGGPYIMERGRGFRYVGNVQQSQSVHNHSGGVSHPEGGRSIGNLNVGNGRASHTANTHKSFDRKQGNEKDPNPVNNQWDRPLDGERGLGFEYNVENEHESNPGKIAKVRPFDDEHTPVKSNHRSQPTKTQKAVPVCEKQGRDLNQKGRGQHHKGNSGRHCTRAVSRDLEGSWRSGRNPPKLSSIPRNQPNKSERPMNQTEPKTTSNHCNKEERSVVGAVSNQTAVEKKANEVLPTPSSNSRNDFNKIEKIVNEIVPEQKYLDFPFIENIDTVRLLPQFLVMFICRGLPGSGKSTIANTILQKFGDDAVVCSANHYLYNEDGDYVWNKDLLQEAHSKCQKSVQKYAALKKPIIIIDNTNVKHSEVEPYINYAKQHSYVVVLVEPRTPWKRRPVELKAKTTHDVPMMTIRKRLEQYEEVVPIYFAWFLSPAHRDILQTLAKDILLKCLQLTEFQHCIKEFTGHSSSEFTVDSALSYYSIKHFAGQDLYHVTACFSPQRKYLAESPYHKSKAVEKALGEISELSIMGLVVTKDTFSARVLLTQQQQQLWKNDDDQTGLQKWKRGHAGPRGHSLQAMTRSFQRLSFSDNGKSERPDCCTHVSTHITLGTRPGITPGQCKYDVQTVVNHELANKAFEEYPLLNIGTAKKYSDTVWAVHFNVAQVVPAIFSGYFG